MANKKTEKKNTTKKAPRRPVSDPKGRKGGRVPTDEERAAKGQIRRTLRVSDAGLARRFEKLEELHGGTSGAVVALVHTYEQHHGPIQIDP